MLTPHYRKDSKLGKIRLAAENLFDSLEFFRRETVFRHQLRSNDRIGGRFGAGHRQRTLTEAERDSTRLRTQLADCEVCCGGSSSPLSAVGRTRPVGALDVGGSSAPSLDFKTTQPKAAKNLASPAERPIHLAACPEGDPRRAWHLGTSPLHLPRRSLAKAG